VERKVEQMVIVDHTMRLESLSADTPVLRNQKNVHRQVANSPSSEAAVKASPAVPSGVSDQPVAVLADVSTQASGFFFGAYSAALRSIEGLMKSPVNREDADVELAEAIHGSKNAQDRSNRLALLNDQEQRRLAAADKIEAMRESQGKMEKAREHAGRARVWKKISAAFQIISAVFMVAAGVLTGLTGGGGMLIVAGVMTILSAADSLAAEKDGKGFMSKGMAIAVTVIGAVLALGTLGASAFGFAGKSAEATSKAVAVAHNATNWATGATVVAAALGTIGAQVINVRGAEYQREGKNYHAQSKAIEADQRFLDELWQTLFGHWEEANESFSAMIDAVKSSLTDRGDTLARVRFSG
jgi:hypothetical protein